MKLWKRNAVVAAIVLFVCVAVYLNWSYNKESGTADAGKTLGQAALVGGQTSDPLLTGKNAAPSASPAPTGTEPAGEDGQSGAPAKGSSYFDSARLNRQQARDSALSLLQQAAGTEDADQTMKDEANASIQTMASLTVSEAQIENLVTAKGYTDCVAFIGDNSVSVVVSNNGAALTDADVAKIAEIVTDETGMAASQIKIIEATE
ncbi:SpoIIIAH-like family protein [Pseudoflavonifractor phocaeensis]|uniref:SpoIIIAH-like family protein n=1 Tax=Pseudoflavonifractor phocaeensis TaxID=1870988 RepID=UPI00210D565F|nr:SpoIIIAH-like family protein [Pseudoflavonifractor phocaeensis]MCQ4864172.1 SpoIIIAH-like family protein [Pseudoflavonifractor phocaeensis]